MGSRLLFQGPGQSGQAQNWQLPRHPGSQWTCSVWGLEWNRRAPVSLPFRSVVGGCGRVPGLEGTGLPRDREISGSQHHCTWEPPQGGFFKKQKHRCPDLISRVSYWLGPGVGPGQPHFLKIPPGDPDSVWLETHDQKWSARSLYHMKEHRPCGPADVGIPLDYWLGTSPSWRGPVFQVFNFLNQERGGSGVAHPALKTGSGSGGVLGRSPNGSSCVVNWGKVWVALGP